LPRYLPESLAGPGHEVIVSQATGGIGNGVSSRNSDVIHAGMQYPTNTPAGQRD